MHFIRIIWKRSIKFRIIDAKRIYNFKKKTFSDAEALKWLFDKGKLCKIMKIVNKIIEECIFRNSPSR
jgi:hypothetical protein